MLSDKWYSSHQESGSENPGKHQPRVAPPTPKALQHPGWDLELILVPDRRGPVQREQLLTSPLSLPGHWCPHLHSLQLQRMHLSSITGDPRKCPMIRIYHLIIGWSPSLSGKFIKCYFKTSVLDMFKRKFTQKQGHENMWSKAMVPSGWECIYFHSAPVCLPVCQFNVPRKCSSKMFHSGFLQENCIL